VKGPQVRQAMVNCHPIISCCFILIVVCLGTRYQSFYQATTLATIQEHLGDTKKIACFRADG
jgi:hypothetical protein